MYLVYTEIVQRKVHHFIIIFWHQKVDQNKKFHSAVRLLLLHVVTLPQLELIPGAGPGGADPSWNNPLKVRILLPMSYVINKALRRPKRIQSIPLFIREGADPNWNNPSRVRIFCAVSYVINKAWRLLKCMHAISSFTHRERSRRQLEQSFQGENTLTVFYIITRLGNGPNAYNPFLYSYGKELTPIGTILQRWQYFRLCPTSSTRLGDGPKRIQSLPLLIREGADPNWNNPSKARILWLHPTSSTRLVDSPNAYNLFLYSSKKELTPIGTILQELLTNRVPNHQQGSEMAPIQII